MNNATLGARLRWARKKHDLSLQELSRRLGVSQGYLSKLETGKTHNPSQPLVSMLCQIYSVRSEWLVRGEGKPFAAEYLTHAAAAGKLTGPLIPHPITIEERTKELGEFIACVMMAGGQAFPEFLAKTLVHVLSAPLALPAVITEVARVLATQLEYCLTTKPAAFSPPPPVKTMEGVLAPGSIAANCFDRLLQDSLAAVGGEKDVDPHFSKE